jgi:hypothetical protein
MINICIHFVCRLLTIQIARYQFQRCLPSLIIKLDDFNIRLWKIFLIKRNMHILSKNIATIFIVWNKLNFSLTHFIRPQSWTLFHFKTLSHEFSFILYFFFYKKINELTHQFISIKDFKKNIFGHSLSRSFQSLVRNPQIDVRLGMTVGRATELWINLLMLRFLKVFSSICSPASDKRPKTSK